MERLHKELTPFFLLPLYLRENINKNLLWVYNIEHLGCIENHIKAKIRKHNEPISNKSLGSRLPKWMTAQKNREVVLKTIKKLKEKEGAKKN